jgi:metal-dependent hydrolase (beta-lactamase superfamily II)
MFSSIMEMTRHNRPGAKGEKMGMRRYILLGLLILSLFFMNYSSGYSAESPEYTVKIVYNNIPGDPESNLIVAGGFSAWIEFNDKAILFDAGGESTILVKNLDHLNLDINKLDAIFISHNHNDHVYGLPILLAMTRFRPTVYVPQSAQNVILEQNPRAKIFPVDKPEQLYPSIWSTG